jgi:hypothetical protein
MPLPRMVDSGLPTTRERPFVVYGRARHWQLRKSSCTRISTRPCAEGSAPPLSWNQIPCDYWAQIRNVRRRLGASQAQFAALVGAAGKAVVYQWDSRKRCPSPVFGERIRQADEKAGVTRAALGFRYPSTRSLEQAEQLSGQTM